MLCKYINDGNCKLLYVINEWKSIRHFACIYSTNYNDSKYGTNMNHGNDKTQTQIILITKAKHENLGHTDLYDQNNFHLGFKGFCVKVLSRP